MFALRFERRARGDGLRAEVRGGGAPFGCKDWRCEAGGKLGQAEAMKTDRRAAFDGNRTREIVNRPTRGADQEDVPLLHSRAHECAGFCQAQFR